MPVLVYIYCTWHMRSPWHPYFRVLRMQKHQLCCVNICPKHTSVLYSELGRITSCLRRPVLCGSCDQVAQTIVFLIVIAGWLPNNHHRKAVHEDGEGQTGLVNTRQFTLRQQSTFAAAWRSIWLGFISFQACIHQFHLGNGRIL